MILPEWHDTLLLIISTVSIIGSFYALSLIIWVTPKSMIEYRRVLFLYSFWDLCFTFVMGIIFCPRLLFPAGGAIIQGIGRDIFYLVKDLWGEEYADYVVKTSFAMVTYTVVNIIAYQDYCLFYRFVIVNPNQKFHNIIAKKRSKIIGFIFIVFISLIFSVPCFLLLNKSKEIPNLMKPFYERHPDMFADVQPDSVLLWFDTGAVKASKDSQKIRLLFITICGGFVISEIISLCIVAWILRILRKNASSFSPQTYKLHRQMTILLYLQILNPIIFIWFPIASCIIAVFLKLDFRRNTGIWGLLFMSFYSISNTILTIAFVSPYRNFTRKRTIEIFTKFLPFLKKYQNVMPVVVPIESTTGNSFNSRNARNNNY